MKTPGFILVLMLSIIGVSACKKSTPNVELQPKKIELTTKASAVIHHSNDFGIELFTRVAQQEDGNLMLSPLSAGVALTMLLNGCQTDTYEQIKQMLGYPDDMSNTEINEAYQSLVSQLLTADDKVKLSIANAIFYRLGFNFKEPFLNTMSNDFDAEVQGLDFFLPSSVDVINQWASDNTQGKIEKVIDDISDETVMFLMNALYFKGDWTSQFDKANTADKAFTLDNGSIVQVPTMFQEKMKAMYYNGNGFEAVEMPYGRTNYSMIVIVPGEGLQDFYQSFTGESWSELTQVFDEVPGWSDVMITLPKFKFDFEKKLNDELQQMGMNDAFSPGVADLSNISDNALYVSFVKQNTFVEVNEEGTEAAAVTTIGIDYVSIGPVIEVNKPFVFAIRERTTNTLLFIGSVANPIE